MAAAGQISANPPRTDYAFKVLVVGDPRVGKTSIINRYVHGSFDIHYKLTLGVDFALKVIHRPSSIIRLQLRDIAGQEKAGTMTRVYYRDANAAVVVFDVTRNITLQSVKIWKQDIDSKLSLPDGRRIPAVLLANKCDLDADPAVTEQVLQDLVTEDQFIGWFLTSAKDDKNVAEAFNFLIDRAISDYEATRRFQQDNRPQGTISLSQNERRGGNCSC
ncbi:hypothetical protein GUITHDRAFT_175417 [Guillardia theta CCMP2712]|uniref:Ras-related protein Rab n=1 Tax=Guillardia theta (strain CCMP2712) TaxID=905079 RepID=L1IKP8_GUITC|nr:hypothetical protein GUITHDRAFT_175417 [Guillardia theta CCMP2712]EKX36796.1 hypothetical protein GUITHDRAFT_175417 [Guillardia theta CCMP2712]|mmetsp:Transcript_13877/g.47969  ORF Transcript_13877/g.47969 Transcript_13877/m.47969 type:complete len:218 (-) Transcript_13877:142-795(-)|eukprot:XP_005823776.1 hypothetical protein GUITHDRAFT_175417 [Guillardia theta CCMP2712]